MMRRTVVPITITITVKPPISRPNLRIQTGYGGYPITATTIRVHPGGDVLAVTGADIVGAAFAPQNTGALTIDGPSTVEWLVAAYGVALDSNEAPRLRGILTRSFLRFGDATKVLHDQETARAIGRTSSRPLSAVVGSAWTPLPAAAPRFQPA
jgi:hypothetical protein